MIDYVRELAECLEEAEARGGLFVSLTDAAICAAALRFFAAASEGVTAIQAATGDLLALSADAAAPAS